MTQTTARYYRVYCFFVAIFCCIASVFSFMDGGYLLAVFFIAASMVSFFISATFRV